MNERRQRSACDDAIGGRLRANRGANGSAKGRAARAGQRLHGDGVSEKNGEFDVFNGTVGVMERRACFSSAIRESASVGARAVWPAPPHVAVTATITIAIAINPT